MSNHTLEFSCVHKDPYTGTCGHPRVMEVLNQWAEVIGYEKLGALLSQGFAFRYNGDKGAVEMPQKIKCSRSLECKFVEPRT